MSCGCLYRAAPYAVKGNALYCDRHLGGRRRVRMACVITLCHRCGRGMVLSPKGTRAKYCSKCSPAARRACPEVYLPVPAENFEQITGQAWMRPADYFKARFVSGFPVPDHIYERNLAVLKATRLSCSYVFDCPPVVDVAL